MNSPLWKTSNWLCAGVILFAASAHAQSNAYVANLSGGNLAIIDTSTNAVVGYVPLPYAPNGVAVAPGGALAYVASQSANIVSVVDTSSNTVTANIPVGAGPKQVAVNPAGTRVYVVDQAANQVSVIDTASNTVIATVGVGQKPSSAAFSPDGTRVFVANILSGDVTIISTSSNTVVGTFSAAFGANSVSVAPNGTRLYVSNQYANSVTVHDLAGNLVATVSGMASPQVVALTPDGSRAVVANANTNSVAVIDTGSNTVIANIPVGTLPDGLAISTDGTQAFVTNYFDFTVSVINLLSNTNIKTITRVGIYPVAVATVPPAPQVQQPPPTPSCTYSISLGSASFPAAGGNASAIVNTSTGCAWTATSNVGWITVTSGAYGSGSGTVFYSVPANTSTSALSGSLTIAGQTFGVTEAGALLPDFSLSLSAPLQTAVAGGSASYTVTVTPSGGFNSYISYTVTGLPAGAAASFNGNVVTVTTSASTPAGTYPLTITGTSGTTHSIPATLTVTNLNAGQPTADSASWGTSSTGAQTLTLKYSSANGFGFLSSMYGLVNTSINGAGGCFFQYYAPASTLSLVNDAGNGVAGTIYPGGGTVSNSQCTLSGAGFTASGSGNQLTLGIPITFSTTFAGSKNVYGYASDQGGQNSGWKPLGTWTPSSISNGLPTADSVSPAAGSAASQTFAFKYSSANGAGYLTALYGLVNGSINGSGGCFFQYYAPGSTLYLYNDAGNGIAGTLTPGAGTTVGNSQCTITGSGFAVSNSGNQLTLTLPITFASAFAGAKNVYGYASDKAGSNSGWQLLGAWTVGSLSNPLPSPDSVSPAAGTGAGNTFSFQYSSVNGPSYLTTLYGLIQSSISSAGGCFFQYYGPGNTLYLYNDAANGLSGPLTPGSPASVSNSQCTISGSGFTVSSSGNQLTLGIPITFSSAFSGAKNVYGYASDQGGLNSGWKALGTWTTP